MTKGSGGKGGGSKGGGGSKRILPDINGIEVLRKIRKQEWMKDIPVLILTNYTNSELGQKKLKLKAEKYLLKTDYTPNQLVKIVKDTLGK